MKKQLLMLFVFGLCPKHVHAAQGSNPFLPKSYEMLGGFGLRTTQGSLLPGFQQLVKDLAHYYVQKQKQQLEDEARRANEKAIVLYKKKIRWADAHGSSLQPGKQGEADFSDLLYKINRRLAIEREGLEGEVMLLLVEERLQRSYLKAEIQRLMSQSLAIEELEALFYKFGYPFPTDDDFLSFIKELESDYTPVFAVISNVIEGEKEDLENERAGKVKAGQFDERAREAYKAKIGTALKSTRAPLKRALRKVIDDPSFSVENVKGELQRKYSDLSDEWVKIIHAVLDGAYQQVSAEWQAAVDRVKKE